MATFFPRSGDRITDANDDPYAGAKVYFYAAGTTTPLDTYSDNALSSANANPVVCDADGKVPSVWMKKASYKWVIKNSDGSVTIDTVDNFDASDGLATIWCGTAGGTADALTLTVTGITALEANRKYRFLVASDNTTTTPTININGYGAKTVVDANGGALVAGDLKAGYAREVVYVSGSDVFQALGLDGADGAAGSASTAGQHTVNLIASGLITRVTNGASAYTAEKATNDIMVAGFEFSASVDQAIQLAFPLPKSYDGGTFILKFYWTTAATAGTGDVVWYARSRFVRNDDAIDGSWGTSVSVSSTFSADGDQHITDETSAMTAGGTYASECMLYVEVGRLGANGSDTYDQTAILQAVMMHLTTNANTDD